MICKEGWSPFAGLCYKRVASLLSWPEARQRCLEEAGVWADLASIPDQRTSSLLVSLLPVAGSYWVGGRYDEGAGAWQWTDGTPLTFSSWGGAPPGSSGHQLAVRFSTGQWEHLPASQERTFLCQY